MTNAKPTYRVLVTPTDRAPYWATKANGAIFTSKSFVAAERKAAKIEASDRCPYLVRVVTDSMAEAEVRGGRAPEFC